MDVAWALAHASASINHFMISRGLKPTLRIVHFVVIPPPQIINPAIAPVMAEARAPPIMALIAS